MSDPYLSHLYRKASNPADRRSIRRAIRRLSRRAY